MRRVAGTVSGACRDSECADADEQDATLEFRLCEQVAVVFGPLHRVAEGGEAANEQPQPVTLRQVSRAAIADEQARAREVELAELEG